MIPTLLHTGLKWRKLFIHGLRKYLKVSLSIGFKILSFLGQGGDCLIKKVFWVILYLVHSVCKLGNFRIDCHDSIIETHLNWLWWNIKAWFRRVWLLVRDLPSDAPELESNVAVSVILSKVREESSVITLNCKVILVKDVILWKKLKVLVVIEDCFELILLAPVCD